MACIRGHRSSKCNHTDRLMIAVRKPGRPLSSCPHLPGARCGCSNVLAALPRQPNCGCSKPTDDHSSTKGSNSPNDASSTTETNSTIGTMSNTSTGVTNGTSSTNGSHPAENFDGAPIDEKGDVQKILDSPPMSPTKSFSRVEKKSSRKPSIQKQPFNPAKLERMDTNSLNIMPAMTSRNQHESIPMSPVAPPATIPLFGDGYQQGGSSPFLHNGEYQTQPLQSWPSMANFPANGGNTTSGAPPKSTGNGTAGPSSCCSARPNPTLESPSSNMGSAFQSVSTQPQPQLQQIHLQVSSQQAWNPTNFTSRSFPVNGNILAPNQTISYDLQHHAPYYSQIPIQPYPPSWGSIAHPLHPAQYQQFIDNSSQAGLQSSYQIPQSPIDLHASDSNAFTSHQCSCGKECQCIGCPAHPYNNSTQELIWDAMKFQFDEDSPKSQGRTNSIIDTDGVKPANDRVVQIDGVSPKVSNTPSDSAASPDQVDPTYPAENYIFVSYPPPPGTVDICPCGPTCECIDCVIHRSLDN